jgi:hypothetical protein
VEEKKVIEEGEEYLVIDGSSKGWIFNIELIDEVKMNDDILKLIEEGCVGVLLRKNGKGSRWKAGMFVKDAMSSKFKSEVSIQIRVKRWWDKSSSC